VALRSLPVSAITLPSDLGGTTNGKLDGSLLVDMQLSPWGAKTRMHHTAARVFTAFFADVKTRFNVSLTCTSIADCYRSYDQQVATFLSRYTTTELPGRPTKKWNGVTYWQKPGTAMAATPGTSNHGWALAMDTAILTPTGQVVSITSNTGAWAWILDNADEYGLSWEAQSEPWHIRFNDGDTVPAIVLAYEHSTDPPLEEDDMAAILVAANDGADLASPFWFDGKHMGWVPHQAVLQAGFANRLYIKGAGADSNGYVRMSHRDIQFMINAYWDGAQLPDNGAWDSPPRA